MKTFTYALCFWFVLFASGCASQRSDCHPDMSSAASSADDAPPVTSGSAPVEKPRSHPLREAAIVVFLTPIELTVGLMYWLSGIKC